MVPDGCDCAIRDLLAYGVNIGVIGTDRSFTVEALFPKRFLGSLISLMFITLRKVSESNCQRKFVVNVEDLKSTPGSKLSLIIFGIPVKSVTGILTSYGRNGHH